MTTMTRGDKRKTVMSATMGPTDCWTSHGFTQDLHGALTGAAFHYYAVVDGFRAQFERLQKGQIQNIHPSALMEHKDRDAVQLARDQDSMHLERLMHFHKLTNASARLKKTAIRETVRVPIGDKMHDVKMPANKDAFDQLTDAIQQLSLSTEHAEERKKEEKDRNRVRLAYSVDGAKDWIEFYEFDKTVPYVLYPPKDHDSKRHNDLTRQTHLKIPEPLAPLEIPGTFTLVFRSGSTDVRHNTLNVRVMPSGDEPWAPINDQTVFDLAQVGAGFAVDVAILLLNASGRMKSLPRLNETGEQKKNRVRKEFEVFTRYFRAAVTVGGMLLEHSGVPGIGQKSFYDVLRREWIPYFWDVWEQASSSRPQQMKCPECRNLVAETRVQGVVCKNCRNQTFYVFGAERDLKHPRQSTAEAMVNRKSIRDHVSGLFRDQNLSDRNRGSVDEYKQFWVGLFAGQLTGCGCPSGMNLGLRPRWAFADLANFLDAAKDPRARTLLLEMVALSSIEIVHYEPYFMAADAAIVPQVPNSLPATAAVTAVVSMEQDESKSTTVKSKRVKNKQLLDDQRVAQRAAEIKQEWDTEFTKTYERMLHRIRETLPVLKSVVLPRERMPITDLIGEYTLVQPSARFLPFQMLYQEAVACGTLMFSVKPPSIDIVDSIHEKEGESTTTTSASSLASVSYLESHGVQTMRKRLNQFVTQHNTNFLSLHKWQPTELPDLELAKQLGKDAKSLTADDRWMNMVLKPTVEGASVQLAKPSSWTQTAHVSATLSQNIMAQHIAVTDEKKHSASMMMKMDTTTATPSATGIAPPQPTVVTTTASSRVPKMKKNQDGDVEMSML